jgi:hypothetical protein
MKSSQTKNSQATISKRNTVEFQEQLSLSQILKGIISSDLKMSRVMELDLYMKDYTLSLSFIPETDSWESSFTKHFNSYIRIRIHANALLAADNSGVIRVQSFVPSASTGGDESSSITILTKFEAGKIVWAHRQDDGIDYLHANGYEKAESISGPFPLQYILNYADIAKYKLYTSPKSTHASPNESILAERDYAVQLIQYLQHTAATRHASENLYDASNSGYGFKSRIHHSLIMIRAESEKVDTPGTETRTSLRRVY